MKIKNLFTGVVSTERADIGRALIRQGMAEEVPCEAKTWQEKQQEFIKELIGSPALPPTPQWDVYVIEALPPGHPHAVIRLKLGAHTHYFSGDPKAANARREWQGGGRFMYFPIECPAEIVGEYKKLLKVQPDLRADYPDPIKKADFQTGPSSKAIADQTNWKKEHPRA